RSRLPAWRTVLRRGGRRQAAQTRGVELRSAPAGNERGRWPLRLLAGRRDQLINGPDCGLMLNSGRHSSDARLFRYAACFLRLASSRVSTRTTWASIAGLLKPFCPAISCTSLSARSMNGAPFCNARAAEAGRVRDCAAAAYFSNGTRSSGLAPSLMQRSFTKL